MYIVQQTIEAYNRKFLGYSLPCTGIISKRHLKLISRYNPCFPILSSQQPLIFLSRSAKSTLLIYMEYIAICDPLCLLFFT